MATKSKTTLGLSCPWCGSDESITLDLNDLDTITCGGCDETYTAEKAALKASENAARWNAVVRGIDAMAEMVHACGEK